MLVANAGSSSVKLRAIGGGDEVLAARDLAADAPDRTAALEDFVALARPVDAVGHRVVHGGSCYRESVLLREADVKRLVTDANLAPLHSAPALELVDTLRRLCPAVPHVACFDTSFHASLPDEAALYALPRAWTERWGLRRYGFHGLSHAYASRRAAELLGRSPDDVRVVSCHLGAGASLAAVAGGRSVDTTMGFTPNEGLVMATRSGSVDPGMLIWLQRAAGISPAELDRSLEHKSGLRGLSGTSGDMREVLDAIACGDEAAAVALAVYAHRLQGSIAAMAAALGGLDALIFTGGVGERSPEVRAAACERLGFLGVALDPARSGEAGGTDADVSAAGSTVRTLVVHAREDLEIAAQVRNLIEAP